MRTPLEALTEITKRIKAREVVYLANSRKCLDLGRHTSSGDFALQASSMQEILNIIEEVERGV